MALIDRSKNKSTVFRDISLSFVRHPVTNDLGIFSNEDAIRRSVTNLTRTRLGERFHNDLIGTPLQIVIGKRDFSQGVVEVKDRLLDTTEKIKIDDVKKLVFKKLNS